MIIRPERAEDAGTIGGVLAAAFAGPAEARLVRQLRADGDLILALIAEQNGVACGYLAFPRLVIETPDGNANACSLAPLAVAPEWQRRGIGTALVRDGLRLLAGRNETLVFVLGDPRYYARFGFDAAAARPFECAYAGTHLMALRLNGNAPGEGTLCYPAAFAELG